MGKIFLSHSSKDKEYVGYIANLLGKDHCTYDEMCFEYGMKNIDEIFKEIDKTSIFVFFISDNSLKSDWVKDELDLAEEKLKDSSHKLSQIFPIIIDNTITYADSRIPDYLKKGIGSYNIRPISTPQVAYKKIITQQKRLINNASISNNNSFYGRDKEILDFKKEFDSGKNIKCIVAAGIHGIGRRSYIEAALKNANIIEEYYSPSVIPLKKFDTIDDLIMRLVELGFGNFSWENIVSISDISEKINILTYILTEVQKYQEHIIILDNSCLIGFSGEIVYWFAKAIENIRGEITVSIASYNKLSLTFLRKNESYFQATLSTLSYPEWNGLMRIYGKLNGLELSNNDREYFKDVITGYPPQVITCVDQILEKGLSYVKDNLFNFLEATSSQISIVMSVLVEFSNSEKYYDLLSFMSKYGVMPYDIICDIFKIDEDYKDIFFKLMSLTLCKFIGATNEYVEVNPAICDYIQRGNYECSDKTENLLKEKVNNFNDSIQSKKSVDFEYFDNVKFYLKENIKKGQDTPENLLYSTIYLNSIYELYNSQEYDKVIDVSKKLKECGAFERYDMHIQETIQDYYCRALARQTRSEFYSEVEYFNDDEKYHKINYNFLRGFMYRNNGEYDKAVEQYNKVISKQANHRGALRELVIVYRFMEDYETSKEYAKLNYTREPDNIYNIVPYFEILAKKNDRSQDENESIEHMLKTINAIHKRKAISEYYEIHSLYALYIEKNIDSATAFLNHGIEQFKDSSYLLKNLFDCYEVSGDIENMKQTLEKLKNIANNKNLEKAIQLREIFYDAHLHKSPVTLKVRISNLNGFTEETKQRIYKKVEYISKKV